MLLNLIKDMMNFNGHNICTFEPFHIIISRRDFVDGIGTPTYGDMTF